MTGYHPNSAQAPRQARDWLDVGIEWASGATAVGMFAYGFALSYSVLHAIAAAAGLAPWAARVWPLGFESFMASAALNALAEQRYRRHLTSWWRRVPWYPWTLTGLTAGASLLLNWFHPAIPLDPPPGWLRSLVYGLPPLAAVFAWHLFLQRIAHRHHPTPEAEAGPVPVPAARTDAVPGTVPAPDPAKARTESTPVPTSASGDGAGTGPDRQPARGSRPSRRSGAGTGTGAGVSAGLLERAVAVARQFEAEHGRPISRDALGRALQVGNRVAGELLRAVRAAAVGSDRDRPSAAVPGTDPAAETGTVPAPAPVPASTAAAPVSASGPGPPAGNGHRPRPSDHRPAPASSSPSHNAAAVP
jgi:Protein of unknown function (DUF2637)